MSDCPAPLGIPEDIELALKPLRAGASLWRFHSSDYPGVSFNPHLDRTGRPKPIDVAEGGARFSPFPDASGKNVPTFYAGSTEKAAALESVFHDLPHEPNPVYSRKKLSDFRMTHFVVARDLLIVELTEPELRQVKVQGSWRVPARARDHPFAPCGLPTNACVGATFPPQPHEHPRPRVAASARR
jgi:hypothetical protein